MNKTFRIGFLALATTGVASSAGAAGLWAGGDLTTSSFGVHAGSSLLRVPLLGTLGIEANAEKGWNDNPNRYALGLTVRDLNLPFTRVDAFGTVGAEYRSGAHLYAEAGLRGPLLGPVGWRAFARASGASHFGAGVGLELRF